MHQSLLVCLSGLSARDRQIVELYYGKSRAIREIGTVLVLTK